MKLIIDDEYDLLALHRSLFAVKFSYPPADPDLPLSPVVAKLANRVLAELEKLPNRHDGENWQKWRKAEKHEHRFDVLIKNLTYGDRWSSFSGEEKRSLVVDGLAPLRAEEATIDRLIHMTDQHAKTSND